MGVVVPERGPLLKGLGGILLDGNPPWFTTTGCTDWMSTQWIAKFKDVPFAVHSDERTGGRRIHVHEFPDRETWANEDLGRRKQTVDVEGFVFGDRSDEWAEQLFAACTSLDDEGIGILFLPVRVPMDARCELVTSSWTEDAQGRLTFSMRFSLEPNAKRGDVPSIKKASSVFLSQSVNTSAKQIVKLARNTFETDFTGDQAHSGRKQAASMIIVAAKALRHAYKQARTQLLNAAKIEFNIRRMHVLSEELADSQRTSADRLSGDVLVRTQKVGRSSHLAAVKSGLKPPPNPLSGYAMRASTNQVINAIGRADEGFGGTFLNSMQLLFDGATNPNDLTHALNVLTSVSTNTLRAAMQTSSARSTKAELELSETVASFVRRTAVAFQCMATLKVPPDKQHDSLQTRKRILKTLDNEMTSATGQNDVWEGFRALRASVTDYTAYWAPTGPATVKIKRKTVQALAVIAADTYPKNKMTGRDRQLMRLNKIRHPLYSPAELSAMRD